jgi:hypothetical protein
VIVVHESVLGRMPREVTLPPPATDTPASFIELPEVYWYFGE